MAAPTAGLHFTEELIEQLKSKAVRFAHVTLHVGAGTFKPVTVENLEDPRDYTRVRLQSIRQMLRSSMPPSKRRPYHRCRHDRHAEFWRRLPSMAASRAGQGATSLFIVPGYRFKIVDVLITNFHLPKSTLLALVGTLPAWRG